MVEDRKISDTWLDVSIANNQELIKKFDCCECGWGFNDEDIKKKNYLFAIGIKTSKRYKSEEVFNELEKGGKYNGQSSQDYFLSLRVWEIKHKLCLKVSLWGS